MKEQKVSLRKGKEERKSSDSQKSKKEELQVSVTKFVEREMSWLRTSSFNLVQMVLVANNACFSSLRAKCSQY